VKQPSTTDKHPGIHYPIAQAPAHGELVEVAPGIRWLRMPLPFSLDHINLWVLDDDDGWTLVDTGLAHPESQRIWEKLLAGPLSGRPIKRVIVTHFHPDHVGMAGWLVAKTGAQLVMSQIEWLWTRTLRLDHGADSLDAQLEFARTAGADDDYLAKEQRRGFGYHSLVKPLPATYLQIRHGDKLTIGGREWEMFEGRGHAPEHACLWCREADVLISGDQVLPKITPIVGVPMWEPDSDPLADFLDTIERLTALPDNLLVLPSHILPFTGLHARLKAMAAHHADRLDDAYAACAKPVTAMQTTACMFKRELDHEHTGFALREALAHLNYLMIRGRVTRKPDANGVNWYRAV
jgi:glyoxylase-like metal-dependent hydrolase (beta-lactamase superfamily II)